MYWPLLGILFIVSLISCAIGFKKTIYFLSIEYGLSIAFCSIAICIIISVQYGITNMSWLLLLQCFLFVIYGFRLSGFLIYREHKSASYRRVLKKATTVEINLHKKTSIFVKAIIWVSTSMLYVALVSPMLFRHMNQSKDWIVPVIGILISLIGLTLEMIADIQKYNQKKKMPNMVATKGLYKMCRFPNYFGEIVFWTGVFVAGVTCYKGAGEWIVSIIAYIFVVYVMFNGAQRLEKRQNKNYGAMIEYQSYVSSTPALLPLLPIYHLTRKKESSKNKNK